MTERLRLWPRRWLRALAGALLPSCCALCGAVCDAAVCGGCHAQYVAARRPRCPCCANPLDAPLRGQSTFPDQLITRRGQSTISDQLIGNSALTPVSEIRALPPADAHSEQLIENSALTPVVGGTVSDQLIENSALTPVVCGRCLAERPAFDATVAACDYASPLDELVLQLKFGARLALAPWFAQMLRDAVLAQPGFGLPELLCPVPLGPRRLAERGFNQALEIARPLAGALGVQLAPRLALRTLDTRAQSGVAPGERRDNIRNAFALAEESEVAGKHVGIVDDVMSSGHTLNELAAEFKRAGAARVTNFVFARTPPH